MYFEIEHARGGEFIICFEEPKMLVIIFLAFYCRTKSLVLLENKVRKHGN